jgi:hypothetical protein
MHNNLFKPGVMFVPLKAVVLTNTDIIHKTGV